MVLAAKRTNIIIIHVDPSSTIQNQTERQDKKKHTHTACDCSETCNHYRQNPHCLISIQNRESHQQTTNRMEKIE